MIFAAKPEAVAVDDVGNRVNGGGAEYTGLQKKFMVEVLSLV